MGSTARARATSRHRLIPIARALARDQPLRRMSYPALYLPRGVSCKGQVLASDPVRGRVPLPGLSMALEPCTAPSCWGQITARVWLTARCRLAMDRPQGMAQVLGHLGHLDLVPGRARVMGMEVLVRAP